MNEEKQETYPNISDNDKQFIRSLPIAPCPVPACPYFGKSS